jgi:hypothetical protein
MAATAIGQYVSFDGRSIHFIFSGTAVAGWNLAPNVGFGQSGNPILLVPDAVVNPWVMTPGFVLAGTIPVGNLVRYLPNFVLLFGLGALNTQGPIGGRPAMTCRVAAYVQGYINTPGVYPTAFQYVLELIDNGGSNIIAAAGEVLAI